jgi:hypothetical protein
MAKASSEPNATMNTCFFIETLPNFAPDYKARSFDAPPQDAARVARPFDSRTAISRYDKKAPQFRGRGAFARESFFVQLGSSASRSLAPDGKRRLNEVRPISLQLRFPASLRRKTGDRHLAHLDALAFQSAQVARINLRGLASWSPRDQHIPAGAARRRPVGHHPGPPLDSRRRMHILGLMSSVMHELRRH